MGSRDSRRSVSVVHLGQHLPRVLVRSVFTPVCNDEVKVVYELEELLAAVIRWPVEALGYARDIRCGIG